MPQATAAIIDISLTSCQKATSTVHVFFKFEMMKLFLALFVCSALFSFTLAMPQPKYSLKGETSDDMDKAELRQVLTSVKGQSLKTTLCNIKLFSLLNSW